MQHLNQFVFLLVNGSPGAVPGVQIVARLLAQWSIYAVAAIMLLAWVRGGSKARISLVLAGMTAVLGLLMNMAIGTLWYVPRPFAVGSIAKTYEKYPTTGTILPAMGYGDKQTKELEETINKSDVDLVVIGTPIDLSRVIKINKPTQRVRYELQEIGQPTLKDVLMKKFGKK